MEVALAAAGSAVLLVALRSRSRSYAAASQTLRRITLQKLDGVCSVCRLSPTNVASLAAATAIAERCAGPATADSNSALNLVFIAVTNAAGSGAELSIVCHSSHEAQLKATDPGGGKYDGGWECFEVKGPMAFELVGVMATISNSLAKRGVSLLAQSTYDTDYIFVKKATLGAAVAALQEGGCDVIV